VPPAVANGQAPWVGEFPGTQRLSLAISLPLRNQTDLDDLLQQLYDPQSPDYRQYLSESLPRDHGRLSAPDGESDILRAGREPTLDLEIPVLQISNLDTFTLPQAKNIKRSQAPGGASEPTGSGPNDQFIGSDMRAAYYGSGPLTEAGQSVGLFEYGGYEISDVQLYFQTHISFLKLA
jgi:hypothetical protein